jgi:hypothetical protein
MSKTILLTGGAGYIGSHTYLATQCGLHVTVILDDFCNSSPVVLERAAAPHRPERAVPARHTWPMARWCRRSLRSTRWVSRHPLCGFQGRWRERGAAAQVLCQQHGRHGEPAAGNGGRWLPHAGFQQQRHGVWRPGHGALLPKTLPAATPTPMATPSWCVKTCLRALCFASPDLEARQCCATSTP